MTPRRRRLALGAALVLGAVAGPMAECGRAQAPATPAANPAARMIALDLNKSQVFHLSRPARDVLVANPDIADVLLRSADTAFVIGKKVGETNVYFFDAAGRQIDELQINVTFDAAAVVAALRRAIPNEIIEVSPANQSVVLTGTVSSQLVANNARTIALQFVDQPTKVIDLLTVRGKNQVMLQVHVTEMTRNTVKELGITPGFPVPLSFNINGANFTLTGNPQTFTTTPFASLATGPTAAAGTTPGASAQFSALLQALESNGLIKTLAEPNLTAVSGENASFLVGGSFDAPTTTVANGGTTTSANYIPFGIQLSFTPVVLGDGLISLRIDTDVSAIAVPGNPPQQLSERRAETTVVLPSGGSIAIAGLLQNDLNNTIQGLPGLMSIPILGALFSSKQFQQNETDLVIAVTALLVKPTDPNAISFPTDGFGPASDFNMYFLGRLNATYTKPTPDAPRGEPTNPLGFGLKSPFGFILE
jgi:pilus assembly protein CpaC